MDTYVYTYYIYTYMNTYMYIYIHISTKYSIYGFSFRAPEAEAAGGFMHSSHCGFTVAFGGEGGLAIADCIDGIVYLYTAWRKHNTKNTARLRWNTKMPSCGFDVFFRKSEACSKIIYEGVTSHLHIHFI